MDATEELCRGGEASQGDLCITFSSVNVWVHGSFWEIHLAAVLCVCALKPVFMILPSSGQDGFGFSFLCPAHLPIPVTLSPLPPFSFPFFPSLLAPAFPWSCSPCCPSGIAGSRNGFQENEGFSTGRTTFSFVLNSPALVWIWEKWLRVSVDGAWSNLA